MITRGHSKFAARRVISAMGWTYFHQGDAPPATHTPSRQARGFIGIGTANRNRRCPALLPICARHLDCYEGELVNRPSGSKALAGRS